MIYNVGIEDIEPNHWVAWSFDRPGLSGKGKTVETALAHLQTLLPDGELRVVEEFAGFLSPQDSEYIVNAFFEDDRRLLTSEEVSTALDELVVSRRDFLAQLADVPPEILNRPIPGELFGSIAGIIHHVGSGERFYHQRLDNTVQWEPLPADPFEAIAAARAATNAYFPTLIGDTRINELVDEVWSARKVLRRTLWHERDHTRHIAERLRELKPS